MQPLPLQVTIWSKPDCPLCDEVAADLAQLADTYAMQVEMRNILQEAEAFERFRYLIPVVEVNGGPLYYPPHSWLRLRAALDEASARMASPQSGAENDAA